MGALAAQIDVETPVVPGVAQHVLAATQRVHPAVRVGGVEYTAHAKQPHAARACIDHATASFGMRFDREVVAQAFAKGGAGHTTLVIGKRAHAVVAAQMADAGRPFGNAARQQLRCAIERKIQPTHAAERIGHHDLRLARAADARLRGQLKRAGRHLAAVLAHAVHIQLNGGRHRRFAEKARRGRQYPIWLQGVIAADLHAAQADRAAPVDKAAIEIAHAQAGGAIREIHLPGTIQAHRFAAPAFVLWTVVGQKDRSGIDHAAPDAEGAHFGGQRRAADAGVAGGIQVVIEQHAWRCAGTGRSHFFGFQHRGGQRQLRQRRLQREPLQRGVVAHFHVGQAVQIDQFARDAVGQDEAEFAQGFHRAAQPPVDQFERRQAAVGLVQGHVQIECLRLWRGAGRRRIGKRRHIGQIAGCGAAQAAGGRKQRHRQSRRIKAPSARPTKYVRQPHH